jgi:hypothetical protein
MGFDPASIDEIQFGLLMASAARYNEIKMRNSGIVRWVDLPAATISTNPEAIESPGFIDFYKAWSNLHANC